MRLVRCVAFLGDELPLTLRLPSPIVLTSISSEFSKANEAAWLGTAYLLAHAAFTPMYGRLSNVMGRRGANQLALGLLFLGTIGCGTAQSMEALVAARFVGRSGS